MEASSSSFKTQEDHFASIRKRDKRLIFIFFSLIILLTMIIGMIIISHIHKYNLQYSKSLNPNPAVREFCSVTYSEFNCIASLSRSIKSTPDSTPTQIFKLSLETAIQRLSKIVPIISVLDPKYNILSQSSIENCSSSLRDSVSQLNKTTWMMVFTSDEQTRREMTAWISVAIDDLSSCMKALDSVLPTVVDEPAGGEEESTAALYGARAAVYKIPSKLKNVDPKPPNPLHSPQQHESNRPAMEASSSSFKPQEDHFASVRKRNKRLIFIFFSLIILLTMIIGVIIISLIHKYNLQYSNNPNPAVREFCSVTYPEFYCISSLSQSIKSMPNSTPTQIFKLSLETATERLSKIVPMISVLDPKYNILSQSSIENCSSSLRDSVSQLNKTTRIMAFTSDEEKRREMIAWISVAIDDLSLCMKALDSVLPTVVDEPAGGKEESTATLYRATAAVYKVCALVIYSKNFLLNFDEVNENFHFAWRKINRVLISSRIVEDLSTVTLFGSYYFVLVFLFCLLLRVR